MKAKKCVLAGILASAMLCQSVFAPGFSWLGNDVSHVQAAASNVALNKTATASGVETGAESCTADKAVDGDSASADSRWSAPRMRPTSGTEQTPQWLMLDLKADATEVESMKIMFYLKVWSTQYKIQTSATGADGSWEDVYTQSGRSSSDETNIIDTITAADMTKATLKRYVRFYFEKLNDNAAGVSVSVREIEIYGTQTGSISAVTSASEALQAVSELTVAPEDTKLQIPQIEGYDIKVYGSEVDKVLSDEGKIAPLRILDRSMNVILQATSKTDASDTAKKNFTVTVPKNTEAFADIFPQVAAPNPEPSVIPALQEWYGYEGDITIGEGTEIVYNDAANLGLAEVAQEMQADLTEICGFVPNVKAGTSHDSDDIYLESLKEDTWGTGDEGYLLVADEDGIHISSAGRTGVLYGTVTVEQILYQDAGHQSVPKGVIRDYPLYAVRGVNFDVARIPTRIQFMNDYTKIMKWYKLNEMQVHLNDNQWSSPPYSGNPADWDTVDASHRLESELFPSLAKQKAKLEVAGDNAGRYDYYYNIHTGTKEKTGEEGELYFTKEDYRNLEAEAKTRGIQVVAELDTPGHSAPYTKYVYANQEEVIKSLVQYGYLNRDEYLDASGEVKEGASFYIHNPNNFELLAIDDESSNATVRQNAINAKIFMKALFDEYLGGIEGIEPLFTTATVSAGVDEYWENTAANQAAFRRYMNYMYELLNGTYGKEVRMWGGLKVMGGSQGVDRNIILDQWSATEDDVLARLQEGFRVVNIPQTYLYTTPGRYHKDMPNEEYLFYNWEPNIFSGGKSCDKGEPLLLGAKAALWGDANRSGTTEADLHERYVRLCAMVGEKTWGGTKEDDTFLEYEQTFDNLREGPGTQIANTIDSASNVVLDYDFSNVSKDGAVVYDASGNSYDGTITNGTVVQKDGESMLKFNGDTTITTPLQTLNYPYTMSFDVYLDGTENNTTESALFSGYDGRLQVSGLDGKLSINRSCYTQSFGYQVENEAKHRITIVGTLNTTKLYVDGKFQKILYAAARDDDNGGALGNEDYADAVNNYRTTFVFPLNVIGDNFTGYLGNIKAYNKALSAEELAAEGSMSGEADVARNRRAYAENKNSAYSSDLLRLYPAWKATDGDGHETGVTGVSTSNESRWSSSNNDTDFLMVDLGENRAINKVVIDWHTGKYAAAYDIQTSVDGESWTTVASVTGNTNALTTDTFSMVTARYVKMQGVQRKSGSSDYGIFEIKVYGSVDKSALAQAVSEAEAVLKSEGIGWESAGAAGAFHDSVVLAKAVQGDVLAGQEEVDAAKASLSQAVADWNLQKQQAAAQKQKLEQKVAEAEALVAQKDSYETTGWALFEAAYRAAKEAADTLSADEYAALLKNLEAAMQRLTKKAEDKNPPVVTKKELAAPAVKAVKSTATRVKVTWNTSANAASYQLYRKVGSKVTKVGTPVTGTTAYDTAPVGGKSMSYYVVALAGSQEAYADSKAGSGKSITLPKATAKVTAAQKKGQKAVTIRWKKVKKATSYIIYRSEGKNGKMKKVATVKKGTTYVDKKVKSKKTYAYKVVAVSAKKYSPMKAAKKAVKIK